MSSKNVHHSRKPAADIINDAALHAVLANLPQAVVVLRDHAPFEVLWRNDAAALMAGNDAALPVGGGSVLAQGIESGVTAGQSVTVHDHALWGHACHSVTLTPLAGYDGLCVLVAVRASAVTADSHNGARETLRSAGLMARMLAHEIKNPLAGIQGAGQLLERAAQDAAQSDLAQLVVRETARIGRLLQRMTVFDNEETSAPVFVPLNVHAPLEYALSALVATFPHVKLVRNFDPSLPDIAGNHDALVQVIDNLYRNAAEAGAKTVTVRSFYNHTAAPVDSRHQRRLPITITIEDDGEGMDEQTRTRLFEPYYTTKAQGQGLGLPIVAKLVDDHCGMIMVASQPGKTVFTIALPHDRSMTGTEDQP